MKFRLSILIASMCMVLFAKGQEIETLLRVPAQEFMIAKSGHFEQIPITWNMEGTIQADLNDGINYLMEFLPNLAEQRFTTVLKKDSTLWPAYYFRAVSYVKQMQFDRAQHDFEKALRYNPTSYEAQIELAKVYHVQRMFAESDTAIEHAILMNKNKALAYAARGDLSLLQGRIEYGLTCFREALQVDDNYHPARIQIAIVEAISHRNKSAALIELNTVLAQDSLERNALIMRAIITSESNPTKSLHDIATLISVNPSNLFVHYVSGLVRAKLGLYEESFADFQMVVKSTKVSDRNFVGQQTWIDKKIDIQNVGAYALTRVYGLNERDIIRFKKAYCLIIMNQYDKGVAVLDSISNPSDEPLVIYLKAVAHEHKGEHEQALKLYSRAIELDNTIADAYKKRGIYDQNLEMWEKSVEDFTRALKLMPDSYNIYKMRGISNYYCKKYEQAIADFDVYLETDSTDKKAISSRGMSYLKLGQKMKAYQDFLKSDNHGAIDEKVLMKEIKKILRSDTTRAMNLLTEFTHADPGFTVGYALKIRIHLSRNEWKPIEETISNAVRAARSKRLDLDRRILYTQAAKDSERQDISFLKAVYAMHLVRQNKPDDALAELRDALELDPDNDLAYLEHGKIMMVRNNPALAAKDFQKAMNLGNKEAKKLLSAMGKTK